MLQRHQGLVALGLISFVAVAQFLPGIIGTLYWPRATRAGFIAGLIGGSSVWCLTLLIPLLVAPFTRQVVEFGERRIDFGDRRLVSLSKSIGSVE